MGTFSHGVRWALLAVDLALEKIPGGTTMLRRRPHRLDFLVNAAFSSACFTFACVGVGSLVLAPEIANSQTQEQAQEQSPDRGRYGLQGEGKVPVLALRRAAFSPMTGIIRHPGAFRELSAFGIDLPHSCA